MSVILSLTTIITGSKMAKSFELDAKWFFFCVLCSKTCANWGQISDCPLRGYFFERAPPTIYLLVATHTSNFAPVNHFLFCSTNNIFKCSCPPELFMNSKNMLGFSLWKSIEVFLSHWTLKHFIDWVYLCKINH